MFLIGLLALYREFMIIFIFQHFYTTFKILLFKKKAIKIFIKKYSNNFLLYLQKSNFLYLEFFG